MPWSSPRCFWPRSARWPLAWAETRPGAIPQEKLEATRDKLEGVREARARPGRNDRRTEPGDRREARRSLGAAPEAGSGRGRTGRKASRTGARDRGAGSRRSAPGAGAGEAAAGARRAAASAWSRSTRPARRTSQRDPRIRRLVGDGGPDRIPAPDPGTTTTRSSTGSRRCATRSARAVERLADAARRRSKTARDASRRDEREVAAARAEAEARFAELKAAQAERQEALDALESRAKKRSATTSPAISEQIASEGGDATDRPGAGAAQPRPGSAGDQRKRSQRPGLGAAGGQGRDLRRQLDRHHPLHLGRRPRLLRILRLRLLRRGQLRPARRRLPRKPARLDRPGDLGRTRAPASGSPSTPTPATPGWSSPASPSTPSAAPARAGTTPGSTRQKAS